MSTKTAAPIEIPPRVVTAPFEPETIRLPKGGQRDPYFGLSRSALNLLILPSRANGNRPHVRSFVIRQRGSKTGIRLISYSSLKAFVYAHADTGKPTSKNQNDVENEAPAIA